MKTLTKLAAIAFALSSLPAAAQQAATPAAPGSAAAPVTPANDPAYTYKTLRLNRLAFDALLAKPEQLVVLDIRRPDEISKIGGFPAYLSIQTSDIQRSLSFIPRDRLIVTVSNRAHRAGAVGDILAGLGYRVVGAIGVLDYQDEGGVLTKIAPPPPRNAAASEGQSQTAAAAAPASANKP
ncbi:MAG TPA: rhodanese-like domain-containing protein [Methylocystis sp.]|nr:rhodanese-like domain-containing protein [Methylocystis sp.]